MEIKQTEHSVRIMRFARIVVTLIIIITLVAAAYFRWLDRPAREFYDAAFKRAVATFAVARTINGVISFAQDLDVEATPIGFGISFSPGEILDPLNDMIERFSWVMLLSSISLGVQRILLEVSEWRPFTIAFIVVCMLHLGLYLGSHWQAPFQNALNHTIIPWSKTLLLISIVFRFAVPLSMSANTVVHEAFLLDEYDEAHQAVTRTSKEIDSLSTIQQDLSGQQGEMNVISRFGRGLSDTLTNVTSVPRRLKEMASSLISNLVRLLVVFLVETVILPLLFLWTILWIIRHGFRHTGHKNHENAAH